MDIYCDSSIYEACFVLEGQEPKVIPYKDKLTSNVGEYLAVLLALEEATRRNYEQVHVLTDSLLVVQQVNGTYKTRNPKLLPLRDQIRELLTTLDGKVSWVPREVNPAGKKLEQIKIVNRSKDL